MNYGELLSIQWFIAIALRIELAGGSIHKAAGSRAGSEIYIGHEYQVNRLQLFNEVFLQFNWVCHTYCLISNHYYVIVETVEGNLSKGMRQLNGVYTQTFNRQNQRVIHLFQDCYKAILVEKGCYFLELSRYVGLNPVRALMLNDYCRIH